MALKLRREGDVSTVSDADLITGGDKDVSYEVRHITVEKYREIVKKHTKRVPNRRTHQMEEELDYLAIADEQLDYALSGWTGVFDEDMNPLPCVAEHKALLDPTRRQAILDRAGANDVVTAAETRDHSFRAPAGVR